MEARSSHQEGACTTLRPGKTYHNAGHCSTGEDAPSGLETGHKEAGHMLVLPQNHTCQWAPLHVSEDIEAWQTNTDCTSLQ